MSEDWSDDSTVEWSVHWWVAKLGDWSEDWSIHPLVATLADWTAAMSGD
jgi:hypothetical protein